LFWVFLVFCYLFIQIWWVWMVFYYGFNLYSSDYILLYAYWPLFMFPLWNSCLCFSSVFYGVILFHFLDILNINGILFICMTDILSQFSGLSFPSSWGSFDEKRFLISISKSLFFYISHGYLRNSPLLQGHKDTALYIVT